MILLLGHAHDPVLSRLQAELTYHKTEAEIVSNLALPEVSLSLGSKGRLTNLFIDERDVITNEISAIVVSELAVNTKKSMSAIDLRYTNAEIYAVWLALLVSAPCIVINRPTTHFGILHQSPLHLRAFARKLGVFTVGEEIVNGEAIISARSGGATNACIDVASDRSFWLSDEYPVDHDRLYVVTTHTKHDSFAVCVRVGDKCISSQYASDGSWHTTEKTVAAKCSVSTVMLTNQLGLDYGICAYSLKDKEPAFSRLYTTAQYSFSKALTNWTTKRLSSLLLSCGSL